MDMKAMTENVLDKLKDAKVYLVGGAVRDALLHKPVKDRDYVVVGVTVKDMLEAGFSQVGKDFPVFLHPETREEYALARTERKIGMGYGGFEVFTDKDLTVEDDLARRDLTINAIAMDLEGNLIDPFNGVSDIENKVLRHVSEAFSEDPLRVLRVARFASRYHHLGFKVADETMELMKTIVRNGEVDHLTSERVFLEIEKTFTDKKAKPSIFLAILHECGALERVLPEVDALYGVPQAPEYHPEIDTGIHTEMVLDQAHRLSDAQFDVMFAALVHDLGKALTPQHILPKHIGHEEGGKKPLEYMAERLKLPSELVRRAIGVVVHHLKAHQALELRPGTILSTMMELDAFRRPDGWKCFLLACEADKKGRLGLTEKPYPQAEFLQMAYEYAKAVDIKSLVDQGITGEALKARIFENRVSAIKKARNDFDFSRNPTPVSAKDVPAIKQGKKHKIK
jgi:tRNA nucleotidyltransferase (CCA-adding enzyme)